MFYGVIQNKTKSIFISTYGFTSTIQVYKKSFKNNNCEIKRIFSLFYFAGKIRAETLRKYSKLFLERSYPEEFKKDTTKDMTKKNSSKINAIKGPIKTYFYLI